MPLTKRNNPSKGLGRMPKKAQQQAWDARHKPQRQAKKKEEKKKQAGSTRTPTRDDDARKLRIKETVTERHAANVKENKRVLLSDAADGNTPSPKPLTERQISSAVNQALDRALSNKPASKKDVEKILRRVATKAHDMVGGKDLQKEEKRLAEVGRNVIDLLQNLKASEKKGGNDTRTNRTVKNLLAAGMVGGNVSLSQVRTTLGPSRPLSRHINKKAVSTRRGLMVGSIDRGGADVVVGGQKLRCDRVNTTVVDTLVHQHIRVDSFSGNVVVPIIDRSTGEDTGKREEHPVRPRTGTVESMYAEFVASPEYKKHLAGGGGDIKKELFRKNICKCVKVGQLPTTLRTRPAFLWYLEYMYTRATSNTCTCSRVHVHVVHTTYM